MILPAETVHLPFEDGPFRMAMGLQGRPETEMIELDARYPDELAERRRLLATRHAEVFAALPESAAARAEVLARLGTLLPAAWPDFFARSGDWLDNRITGERWNLADPGCDPLEAAGRLVQEDLCIIHPDAAGPVLTAAVLCFPSRWRLSEKIGHPLATVHGPVPLYGERLANPVDRLMRNLRPGRLAVRLNWSVMDDPALFQPTGHGRTGVNAAVTVANAGETLFLRVERQTLSLLPASGSVLFTIRVHVTRLDRAVRDGATAARLAGAVRALPEAMARYKSIPAIGAALLGWLDRVSAETAASAP
jgi:hypothetical protein